MLWTLKKIWYRVFQFVLTSVMYLLPWRQPELLTGPGSIKKLPAFIKSKGVNNVLIVTDSVLRKLGVLDSFLALIAFKEKNYENVIEITKAGEKADSEYAGLVFKWKEKRYEAYKALNNKEEQIKLLFKVLLEERIKNVS